MPPELLMIKRGRRQNGVTRSRPAEVVLATRLAIDGNEEEASSGYPLRDGVRQALAAR